MSGPIAIRKLEEADGDLVAALYADTFPDENLAPLVDALMHCNDALAWVAADGETLVGHIAITRCRDDNAGQRVSLLGPLAVKPSQQGRGIGTALVRHALKAERKAGCTLVVVLGDPAYYTRFGFASETSVAPPFPIVPEWKTAWQSLRLDKTAPPTSGALNVPAPWQDETLWCP